MGSALQQWAGRSSLSSSQQHPAARALQEKTPHDYLQQIDQLHQVPKHVKRQIDLDVTRTFPNHPLFKKTNGRNKLETILTRYAKRDPNVGYVQGMGFIAAVLLTCLEPDEAFWMLAAIIETICPPHFFSHSLLGLRVELAVFGRLVCENLPRLSYRLACHGVEPQLYATQVNHIPPTN